jgi:hypothetical protein
VIDLAHVVHQLWEKCCEEDDIAVDSKFAVFSKENRFVPFYERAKTMYDEALSEYNAGGYVGLQILNGRAR